MMMMKLIDGHIATVALLAAGLGVLTGCGLGRDVRSVDGRRYTVPKEHLITANIPWLPASQRDGLMFLLNPSDRPQQQVIVLLEDNDQACVGRNATAYMRSLCDPSGNARFEGAGAENALVKLPPRPDNVVAYYVRRDRPAVFIAECIASVSPGVDGMCDSVGAYGKTHFTIRFPERSIQNLPTLVAQTDQFLQAWAAASA